MATARYSQIVLEQVSPKLRQQLEAQEGFDSSIQSLVERAQKAWPKLNVPAEDRALPGQRLPENGDTALSDLHAEDLFIACGCALGDSDRFAPFATSTSRIWRRCWGG